MGGFCTNSDFRHYLHFGRCLYALWNAATPPGNSDAHTIIHELLHATIDIFGSDAVTDPWWTQYDADNPAAQDRNWLEIMLKCGI